MSAHMQSVGMYGYSGDARIYNANNGTERVELSVTSSHFVYFVCVCVCADQVFEQQQRAVRLFTAQPSTGVERGTHRESICSLVNLFCN